MNLDEVVRRRQMVRSFAPAPVDPKLVGHLVELALRAPSAGFAQGVEWLVLEGDSDTRRFFEATCDPDFLAKPRGLGGLLRAPVIALPLADPAAYTDRYAEEDKAGSGLAGIPAEQWPTPYWIVDAAFAVMLLLLAATDAGLGALFFRLHRDPAAYLADLGVPPGRETIGAVALGYESAEGRGPAGSPSRRQRRPIEEVYHRGRW